MTIHCFDIEYDDVSDETLDFMDDCHMAIVLPNELDIDIDDEKYEEFGDDLDALIADRISDETEFLVKSFNWEKN